MPTRPTEEKRIARELVRHYQANLSTFQNVLTSLQEQIRTSQKLAPFIHSLKWRTKSFKSLEGKIFRKIDEAKDANSAFDITPKNLFLKINDLAGLRILHLNTDQLPFIASGLNALFEEEIYTLFEQPTARTWDDESRAFLTELGFKIINKPSKPSFYTSVHYVIKPSKKTEVTCEIQVRTLMEEVWGEVDHLLNYPDRTKFLPCKEQIAALARATSTCSRLVDSIFRSHADLSKKRGRPRGPKVADTPGLEYGAPDTTGPDPGPEAH
jgi:ppGpp synthetase/RelA/SpoT-type nucleotidyltranferase